jgi:hypothetical protein
MVKLLAAALASASSSLSNGTTGRAALQAAQKAKVALRSARLGSVQQCSLWKRNRDIRIIYNARKKVLDAQIQQLSKEGASNRVMAEHAYEFRRNERLVARQRMRENGDVKSLEALEKRDAKKYGLRGLGDKDGPNFEGLKQDAAAKLSEILGRTPSDDEVFEHIVASATRTDFMINLKLLTF